MLGQRRKRWSSINPTLTARLVFAGRVCQDFLKILLISDM